MFSQQSRLCNSEFRSILFGANYKTTYNFFSVSVYLTVSMGVCVCVLPNRQTILLEYKKCENFSAIIVVFVGTAAAVVVRVINVENMLQAYALFLHSLPIHLVQPFLCKVSAKFEINDFNYNVGHINRHRCWPRFLFRFLRRCWAHSSQFNVCAFARTVYFTVNKTILATSRFKI